MRRFLRPQTLALVAVLTAMAVTLSPSSPLALSPPPAPGGLTAIALDAKVGLSWQASDGADHYAVFRGTAPDAITEPLTTGGVTGTTYTDTSAANGTTYYYAVRAYAGADESATGQLARATPVARSCSSGNDVVQENCYPGTTDWKIDQANTSIEGFATKTSVNAGESVDLKVAGGDDPYTFHVEIYRTGAYGGAQGRLISVIPGVSGGWNPVCETHPADTGLVDCTAWLTRATVSTTPDWTSGVYLLKIVRDDTGARNEILLTVRKDGNNSDVVYDVPVNTYQAYNNFNGKSLYDLNSNAPNTNAGSTHAIEVSFNRPYAQPQGGPWVHDWYTRTDLAAVSWLEGQGYDVTYTDDVSIDANGGQVADHKVYVAGVHNEYWTQGMRDAVTAARDSGTSLVFLGANASFWRIRFAAGTDRRHLIEYKTIQGAPSDPGGPTSTWRDPAGPNNPENTLVGGMYIGDGPNDFPMRVSASEGEDRVWRYTSLGDQPPGTFTNFGTALVGWEWDAAGQNNLEPDGLRKLSSSPVNGGIISNNGAVNVPGSATANTTIYKAASGALVFDAGTMHWTWGLANNVLGEGEANGRIRQATTNVLADMGVKPATPSGVTLDSDGAPQVTASTPADGATSVSLTAPLTVTFDRELDRSTVTTSSFELKQGATVVPATVTLDQPTHTVTIDPADTLDGGVTYTLHLAGFIASWSGQQLPATDITFTTGAAPPLALDASTPANGATGVAVDTDVTAKFNRAVDQGTVSGSTFTLTGPGGAVAGTVSYDSGTRTARLVPGAELAEGTAYTATLSGVHGADGSTMADTSWSFTTGTKLRVTGRSPADLATGVSTSAHVRITFSRDVDDATLTSDYVRLTESGEQVPAQITYDPGTRSATLIPSAPLELLRTYTVIVTSGVRAVDGAPLVPTQWSFSTDQATPPSVTGLLPAAGATDAFNGTAVKATFDQALDPVSVTGQSFTLAPDSGPAVSAAVTYNDATHQAVLTPNAPLAVGTHYTATLTTGITNTNGTPLQAPVTWSFTTADCPCSLLGNSTPAETGLPGTFELGVRFTSASDAQLIALRFYKSPGETGTHVGKVWDSAGILVGQATFTNETASGWQRQVLDTFVPLQAGQVYTTSVNINARWVKTGYVMRDPISSGPITSMADGLNGTYNDVAGAFPTSMWLWSNYFVDPVVRLTSSPVRTPEVVSTSPTADATGVDPSTTVRVTFNQLLDEGTVSTANLHLTNPAGDTVAASLAYDQDTKSVTLTPTNPLHGGTAYTMHVTGVRSDDETPLPAPVVFTFSTVGSNPPVVQATAPASGAAEISPSTPVTATFDQRMDPGTISSQSMWLTAPGGAVVPSTVGYASATRQATLTPNAPLAPLTTYTLHVSTDAQNESGQGLQTDYTSSFTTSEGCPCRLFGGDPSPATSTIDTRNGRPGTGPFSLELGVKFQVSRNAQLVAVRFRRDPWETGTHEAHIWTASGTLIATVPFTNETAGAWQRQVLDTPLALTPGQVYVASVGINERFGMTANSVLATGVSSGPVSSVVDGANGVFSDAAATFPNQTWGNSNYFVDVDVQ